MRQFILDSDKYILSKYSDSHRAVSHAMLSLLSDFFSFTLYTTNELGVLYFQSKGSHRGIMYRRV